jgi:hypothetical protein
MYVILKNNFKGQGIPGWKAECNKTTLTVLQMCESTPIKSGEKVISSITVEISGVCSTKGKWNYIHIDISSSW